ncbi:MAG: NF038122 family metalloprotease, partial [Limisphaerales bacterium]
VGIGGTTSESHTMGLVGATAGTYNVYVTVDANSEVTQTNTSNDTSAAVPLTLQAPAGLIINPIYDSTITSDPNAATIQNTINTAIQQYEGLFSDPITVNILFSKTNTGLGQSFTFLGSVSYSSFLNALTSDAKTTNDAVAVANLPVSANNPANGNTSMFLTLANLRALGLSGTSSTNYDSHIFLNFSIINLTRSSIDPSKYDLMAVAQHEIDEALGFGSCLNGLANGSPPPTGPVRVMDLFRYDQNGARSLNTTSTAQAYFSMDGVTDVVRFNQSQGGDYQDWYSPGGQTPRVQDAFGTPGATPNLGVELLALDAIGYNLVSAIPVPRIITTAKNGNTLTLSWTSQTNLNYQLQYKTNVAQVGWSTLGSAIKATNSTTSASDTLSATQRFYRVAVLTASSSIATRLAPEQPVISISTNYFWPSP